VTGSSGPARDDLLEEAGPGAPAGTGPPGAAPDLAGLIRAAVRDELDTVLPHVLAALKRDRAFDDLSERLTQAERRLEARRERPLAVSVHRLLNRLRHLDFDQEIKASLEAGLVKILTDAGFEEMGQAGDPYDPDRHDALGGQVIHGAGTVTDVDATGLSSFGDVVVRAQVQVAPVTRVQPQAGAPTEQESATEPVQ
jgi:hypothetical protein